MNFDCDSVDVKDFVFSLNSDFYTGVPDSQLRPLCDYLMNTYGVDNKHHIIAANEGNCVGIAAGYYLATGKVPVVYLQNSGEGNIVNPVTSLMSTDVYAIPCIFIIGWRGEPGIHDEPQHKYQGKITLQLPEMLGIETMVIDETISKSDISKKMFEWNNLLSKGRQVAFIIKKGSLTYTDKVKYSNSYKLNREDAIRIIISHTGSDHVISTTGKISRELFEIREANDQGHSNDFLTVGSMGHCSSIALGIAISKPDKRVWCIDGDGSLLMHMGAMAILGTSGVSNLIHIVLNNTAHDTVGGMPTVADRLDLVALARGCGYTYCVSVNSLDTLDSVLKTAVNKRTLCFIEIKCALGSRVELGRPTTTPIENRDAFMSTFENP